jgi:hypothetical protein
MADIKLYDSRARRAGALQPLRLAGEDGPRHKGLAAKRCWRFADKEVIAFWARAWCGSWSTA